MALGLSVVLGVASAAQAAHMTLRDDERIPLTIQGKPLLSIDDVMKVFSANGDNFYIWCVERSDERESCLNVLEAGRVTNIHLSRTLIDLTCVYPSENILLDIAQIGSVELYQFPTMETFQYGLKIARKPSEGAPKAHWFRVRNIESASALANAFRSLPPLMSGDIAPPAPTPVQLGISARDLSPDEAKQAGAAGGVYIGGVDPGSLAEQMAVKQGDYLLEVNGVKVSGLEAMKNQLATGTLKTVAVWRNGKTLYLSVLSKL
ncbi:MAG: PDZ domain-containing protein [Rhizomicrobium sp.]